jgi:hypothetical protein
MPSPSQSASGYRYAGAFLAAAQSAYDPQHQHMGMIELGLNALVPGGKEPLIFSLEEATVPGRKIGTNALPYLNGNNQYLTRPEKMDNMSLTFRDFPKAGTRGILARWFQNCFDEATGLMLPMSLLKINGFVVLFQTDATEERSALITGIVPIMSPEIAIKFAEGAHMPMKVDFMIDSVQWQPSLFNPV